MGLDIADVIVTAIVVLLAIPLGIVVLPIAAVVLIVRWAWRRAHPKSALPPSAQPYAYLEDDATQDAVVRTITPYTEDAVLGPYAQGILDTFAAAERRKKGIFSILEDEFSKSSLTWDKFSAPVEVAFEKVVYNAAQIANRMQAFDSKEFQRMGRIEKAGGYSDDRPEVQRLATMRSSLEEMDRIQQKNDRLLTELEKLQAELTTMAGAGYATATDEVIEEIRKLAEDTQYYV